MIEVQTYDVTIDLILEEGDIRVRGTESKVTGREIIVVQEGGSAQANGAVNKPYNQSWDEENLQLFPMAPACAKVDHC